MTHVPSTDHASACSRLTTLSGQSDSRSEALSSIDEISSTQESTLEPDTTSTAAIHVTMQRLVLVLNELYNCCRLLGVISAGAYPLFEDRRVQLTDTAFKRLFTHWTTTPHDQEYLCMKATFGNCEFFALTPRDAS